VTSIPNSGQPGVWFSHTPTGFATCVVVLVALVGVVTLAGTVVLSGVGVDVALTVDCKAVLVLGGGE